MPDLKKDTTTLPPHVEDTVQAIIADHAEHYQRAAPLLRIVGRVTATVGCPAFAVILTVVVLGWVSANVALMWAGRKPWDPPPFPYLTGATSLVALYTTIMILTSQRHDDELARHREQLTLEIAILSEQKSAKIIQMLKQMRNDNPLLASCNDKEVEVMSDAADPRLILNAIKGAHQMTW